MMMAQGLLQNGEENNICDQVTWSDNEPQNPKYIILLKHRGVD